LREARFEYRGGKEGKAMAKAKKIGRDTGEGLVAYVVVRGNEYVSGFTYPVYKEGKRQWIAMSLKQARIASDCYANFTTERRLAYEWIGETAEASATFISGMIPESFVVDGMPYKDMMAQIKV
jgi:hypothetical protein